MSGMGHNGGPVSETHRSGMARAKPRPCPSTPEARGAREAVGVCKPQPYRAHTRTGWAAACGVCGRAVACAAPEEAGHGH